MKKTLPYTFPVLLLLLLANARTEAQIFLPFLSNSGLPTATTKAKDSIGADAKLALIATFGALEQGAFKLEFNLNNGKADAWLYNFFSPSQSTSATLGVVQIPILGYQTQSLGSAIPLPAIVNQELDLTGQYSNSDQMIAQLQKDTAFQRYRTEMPNSKPAIVTLGSLFGSDSIQLPGGFPLNEPLWTVWFRGGGDSSMTCFVSTKSGAYFCRRFTLPVLSVPGDSRATTALNVVPNPTGGRTRIMVSLPAGARLGGDARCELFDERGARVMDVSDAVTATGDGFEFDSGALAPGLYFCRIADGTWSGSVGVIIER